MRRFYTKILQYHSFHSAASILSAISDDIQSGGSNCQLEVDKEEVRFPIHTHPPLYHATGA